VWNNLKSDALAFMGQVREWREVDEQLSPLETRVTSLVHVLKLLTLTWIPRVIDLYTLDFIREIIERPLVDGEDTVDPHDFEVVLTVDLEAILAQCRTRRVSQLLEALRTCENSPAGALNEDHLRLATSVFVCKPWSGCSTRSRYMHASEMLVHRCYSKYSASREDWTVHDPYEQLRVVCSWVLGAGSDNDVEVDEEIRRRIATVVRLAGLDPLTATVEDMNRTDAWFECTTRYCRYFWRDSIRPVTMLDWKHAVSASSAVFVSLLTEGVYVDRAQSGRPSSGKNVFGRRRYRAVLCYEGGDHGLQVGHGYLEMLTLPTILHDWHRNDGTCRVDVSSSGV
jgi:hypothetical protein